VHAAGADRGAAARLGQSPRMSRTLTPRIALLLTLPPLMWAGNAVVGRLAVPLAPPAALNLARWGLVALLLLPLGWRVLRQGRAIRARLGYLLPLGVLGVGTYNGLQYLALHTATPMTVTLIAASSPVWMLLIGAFAYRTRPSGREIAGAALSLLGVAVVLSRGHLESLLALRFVTGDLLMLLAIFAWAVYSWLLARPPASMQGPARPAWNWAEMLLVQVAFGLVWSGAGAGLEALLSPARWHWSPWLPALLLYVAIGPSIIAYRAWGIGVATVGPAVAAFFGNLTPLFAALLSAALLGEAPQAHHVAAFALIVGGIVVAQPPRRHPAAAVA